MTGKLTPEKPLPYQSKTGQLCGCTTLHGPACGLEQAALVGQIKLRNIQKTKVLPAWAQRQADPCHPDFRIRQPAASQANPLLEFRRTRLGQLRNLFDRIDKRILGRAHHR